MTSEGKGEGMPTRIREWRKKRGWTQSHLAQLVGVDTVHISNLETGRRNANIPMLRRIASALGCSVADLLASADNPLELDEEATQLVRAFIKCDQKARSAILSLANSLS